MDDAKRYLEDLFEDVLHDFYSDLNLSKIRRPLIQHSKDRENGDLCSSVALQLASQLKKDSRETAKNFLGMALLVDLEREFILKDYWNLEGVFSKEELIAMVESKSEGKES
jgi:arginyl-tRNA synthetase